jgi:hypothetical protein
MLWSSRGAKDAWQLAEGEGGRGDDRCAFVETAENETHP